MARPLKEGLDYFPLNVDIDQDDKVAIIETIHGITGFGIVIKLLMKIYSEDYFYKWGEKEQILFSKRVNVDINEVNVIINDCVKWGLFDEKLFEDHNILTSAGIQRRFLEITKRRKRVEMVKQYLLLNNEDIKAYSDVVYVNINSQGEVVNDNISTQSKVKESKVKESKEDKSDTSVSKSNVSHSTQINYEALINFFNEETKGVFGIVRYPISDKRRGSIRARINDHGKDTFVEMIQKAYASDFLKGDNKRDFKATFDWLIRPNNFQKTIEGNYDNKQNYTNGTNRRDSETARREQQIIELAREAGMAE